MDVADYIDEHPGGKRLISDNIGRDVSKFFYGGYAMGKNGYPYAHSQEALSLVFRKLAIARLVYKNDGAPKFSANLAARKEIVSNVFTVTFGMERRIPGVQSYYSDLDLIGRHYLVWSKDLKDKKRQYTICNVLDTGVYKEYIKAIDSFKNNQSPASSSKQYRIKEIFTSDKSSNEVSLTLKDYNVRGGLSSKICRDPKVSEDAVPKYFLKGPMGKGLDLKTSGVHIAFTGGTGVLPFLDLVAHLIRLNLGMVS